MFVCREGFCQGCGKFVGNYVSSGKSRTWCSSACRVKAKRRRVEKKCEICSRVFWTTQKKVACCSGTCAQKWRHKKAGTLIRPKKCVGCGREFLKNNSGRNKGKYCSRECAFETWIKQAEENAIARGVSDGAVEWMNSWKVCAWCMSNNLLTRYQIGNRWKCCDFNCSGHLRAGAYRPCIKCGCQIDRRESLGKRLCDGCAAIQNRIQRRRSKLTRKNRMHGCETFDDMEIFTQDRWHCWICLGMCKRTRDPTDMARATIDHVIPLSKRGLHTRGNCRTAHAICNSIKSDG